MHIIETPKKTEQAIRIFCFDVKNVWKKMPIKTSAQ